ncbi:MULTISPECIES: peptidylprolyl isomerase [unclassified Sphingomonas]|uniref:peptidylprolyl isomerase n=1 Tax=unclassified Sphingomonas TaxID=196159 RepID=UPI0028555332|nr:MULTISPECIES: peptidylprolyl isomerase [unclassified Sphingomonas]MDR6114683.1 cyclophilin family peptidyl-prolyl cis-trans isomerase [Sphingomonas sp. SORGH_AS_0789]MDR6151644.1 cyclophilin family peptidyl-prolyl cis-trans isomerase [Sphingomonas sp. SORGH_AS_0742]
MTIVLFLAALLAQASPSPAPPATQASDPLPGDWIAVPDDELLIFTLSNGRTVTVRLAAGQAPVHVANIRALARAHWWDAGTSVYRVQENYVAQWGDATEKKPLPPGIVANPPAEYVRAGNSAVARLSRPDPYAAWAGYSRDGWPLAGDAASEWIPHCYGMVGVARDLAPSTGTGAELYTIIGHSPRGLDRNIAMAGRVIDGMEALSTLPRGTGDLGFYKDEAQRLPILSARLASELPAAQRPHYQYRETASPRFAAWIKGRENRKNDFFTVPAGGVDICAALPPVRKAP